jgi:hypothetical protein
MVKPTVGFGSETWAVGGMDLNRLGTRKRGILRRIYGPVVEKGIWRKRTDQGLREIKI